jgi:hypothetical protein
MTATRIEMTITISLADAEGGTEVLAVHDRLPPEPSTAVEWHDDERETRRSSGDRPPSAGLV